MATKMAVSEESENSLEISNSTSFSFKLSTKSSNKKVISSKPSSTFVSEIKDDFEEKDYVLSAEKDGLQSTKPKKEKKELVIPLIQKNKWRIQDEKNGDGLSKEAAEEIMKDLENEELNGEQNAVMPILMKNRLPLQNGETSDEKYDISIRPEQSSMEDYESIPITAFGTAMLRGMGWSEGKPIGLNSTGLCEPIEYIPRHKGLGLGAEKRMQQSNYKRIKKLGETTTKEERYQPIVEADGRVRHVKGIGEEVKSATIGFYPGNFVQILKGVHKSLYGKIIAVDEDNTRLSLKLTISGEVVELSQHNSKLVDKDEHQKYGKGGRKSEKNGDKKRDDRIYDQPVTKKKRQEEENIDDNPDRPCWMAPNIRVRIISRTYRNGKYYNKKVKIIDVISTNTCTCRTDEKRLLEDVRQSDIETIIPKTEGAYVMIVGGKYKNEFHRKGVLSKDVGVEIKGKGISQDVDGEVQLGKLLERHKKEEKASIQLTSNKHITNVRYDYISEYVGEMPDDHFL